MKQQVAITFEIDIAASSISFFFVVVQVLIVTVGEKRTIHFIEFDYQITWTDDDQTTDVVAKRRLIFDARIQG